MIQQVVDYYCRAQLNIPVYQQIFSNQSPSYEQMQNIERQEKITISTGGENTRTFTNANYTSYNRATWSTTPQVKPHGPVKESPLYITTRPTRRLHWKGYARVLV